MVKYSENELYSITDFAKKLSSIVKGIKESSIEKVGILKNNKLEVVVIASEEYSRLKDIEQKSKIKKSKKVQEAKTPEYLSIDDMAKKFNIKI